MAARGAYTLLALIALGAAILRLYHLDAAPVFYDEDLYIRAALRMTELLWHQAVHVPSSMAQSGLARPPLVFLVHAWLIPAFNDPIIAGRVVSAIFGTITTVLCFFLGRRLGGGAVGLVAATLYALSPIAVLHERMVLQDGPLATWVLATVLVAWTAIDRGWWKLGCTAALLGAAAVLTKQSGLAVALAPPILLLFAARGLRPGVAPAALASVGPLFTYAVLMLGPLAASQAQEFERQEFVNPMGMFGENLSQLGDILATYFPAGLWLLAVVGALLTVRQRPGVVVACLWMIALYTLSWAVVSRFLPARYTLPAAPFICALAAVALVQLPMLALRRSRLVGTLTGLGAALLVAASGASAVHLAASHATAPMTALDACQYRSCWPSGYAYAAAARFVSTLPPGSSVLYMVDGSHRIAAGMHRPPPVGVTSLGRLEPREPLPRQYPGDLYILVDDEPLARGRDETRITGLLARERRLEQVARFTRPGADAGVTVLRLPERATVQ